MTKDWRMIAGSSRRLCKQNMTHLYLLNSVPSHSGLALLPPLRLLLMRPVNLSVQHTGGPRARSLPSPSLPLLCNVFVFNSAFNSPLNSSEAGYFRSIIRHAFRKQLEHERTHRFGCPCCLFNVPLRPPHAHCSEAKLTFHIGTLFSRSSVLIRICGFESLLFVVSRCGLQYVF